jgi:uncharacterized membrane protein
LSTATTAVSTKSVAKSKAKSSTRFWEIDTLRGVAIVMMIIFHLMWDLWYFGVRPETVLYDGFWKYFQRTIPILFLSLAGISLTLSYRFAIKSRGNTKGLFKKFLLRGLKVFGLGMIITIAVWAAGVGYVHFGILHLIGFSIIAAYPFLPYRWINLVLWILFVIGGYFIQDLHIVALSSVFEHGGTMWPLLDTDPMWLAWLGLTPRVYVPVDYFPVIPWFGVVLLGLFLGNTLYTTEGRNFYLPDYSAWLPVRFLSFLGRHSLLIYVIHQPILIALLYVFGIIQI